MTPFQTSDSYITINIMGEPIAQARPRLYKRGHKTMVFDPQAVIKKQFELQVIDQLSRRENEWQMPEYPRIWFKFYMPIPKSLSKMYREYAEKEILKHAKKPDVDNLIKLYLDVLVGHVLQDDNCVSIGGAIKLYSTKPRTQIYIQETDKIVSMKELYE